MKSDYILFWLFNKIIEALDSQEQMHILCEEHYVKATSCGNNGTDVNTALSVIRCSVQQLQTQVFIKNANGIVSQGYLIVGLKWRSLM